MSEALVVLACFCAAIVFAAIGERGACLVAVLGAVYRITMRD